MTQVENRSRSGVGSARFATPGRAHLLVQATADDPVPPGWTARAASLEELALAYLRQPGAVALHGRGRDRGTEKSEVTK